MKSLNTEFFSSSKNGNSSQNGDYLETMYLYYRFLNIQRTVIKMQENGREISKYLKTTLLYFEEEIKDREDEVALLKEKGFIGEEYAPSFREASNFEMKAMYKKVKLLVSQDESGEELGLERIFWDTAQYSVIYPETDENVLRSQGVSVIGWAPTIQSRHNGPTDLLKRSLGQMPMNISDANIQTGAVEVKFPNLRNKGLMEGDRRLGISIYYGIS